ncbi:MAG: PH domain-containing protein [Corynebacterium sp.]|nr:PH domain-containing protein [Corynebacterium sp.]
MRLWWSHLLVIAVVTVVLCVPIAMFEVPWLYLPLLVLVVLEVAYSYIQIRHTAWKACKNDIIVRKGRLWQTVQYVPYGRVQYFEVSRNILANIFGYATVEIHTASAAGDASIPGILAAESDRLKAYLSYRARMETSGL